MSRQLVLPDLFSAPPAVKTGPVKNGALKAGAVKTGSVKTGPVKTQAVKTQAVKTGPVKTRQDTPRTGHQLDHRTRERGLRGVEEARRALAAAVEHQHLAA